MFFGFVAYWKKNGRTEGLKLLGVYIASGIVFFIAHRVMMSYLVSLWFGMTERISFNWIFAFDVISSLLLTIAWSRILDWGRPILSRLGVDLAPE
jgi:hypothetical protein